MVSFTLPSGRCHALAAVVACGAVLLAPAPSSAQAAADVVPVSAEPQHKIRFDNGRVRFYEVLLPPGSGTLMHEHRADSFSVVIRDAQMSIEPRGKFAMSFPAPAGVVSFAPATNGPYAHRIVASGSTAVHVVAMELLLAKPGGPPNDGRRDGARFSTVLENARGRAYRYTLAPGESTGTFGRAASSAIVAVSEGRISELREGQDSRLWDFEPGDCRWIETGEKLSVKNEGAKPVELVEIEVF